MDALSPDAVSAGNNAACLGLREPLWNRLFGGAITACHTLIAVGSGSRCPYLLHILGQASIDSKGKRAAESTSQCLFSPLRPGIFVVLLGNISREINLAVCRATFKANTRMCTRISTLHSRTGLILTCAVSLTVTHTQVTCSSAPVYIPVWRNVHQNIPADVLKYVQWCQTCLVQQCMRKQGHHGGKNWFFCEIYWYYWFNTFLLWLDWQVVTSPLAETRPGMQSYQTARFLPHLAKGRKYIILNTHRWQRNNVFSAIMAIFKGIITLCNRSTYTKQKNKRLESTWSSWLKEPTAYHWNTLQKPSKTTIWVTSRGMLLRHLSTERKQQSLTTCFVHGLKEEFKHIKWVRRYHTLSWGEYSVCVWATLTWVVHSCRSDARFCISTSTPSSCRNRW